MLQRFTEARVGVVLVAALYLLAFPYHPGLRSPNELCRLWQSRAIVDHGKLSLNETMAAYGPVGDLSVKDGVYYPSKAPLMSFAAAPIYWVLKTFAGPAPVSDVAQVYWSRLLLTVLPTLYLLWLLRRFLTEFLSAPVRDALVVTYALGSLAFSYSELFMSHQATAVLLFTAFEAAWRALRGKAGVGAWLLAGATAGAAVFAEYTAALTVAALGAWVVVDRWLLTKGALKQTAVEVGRAAGLVLLGAAPFLGALLLYHQACFGHPLASGYKYLADAAYQGWHVGGFLGIRTPDARAFALSFFSPLRGLFALSPFLLVGVGGLWVMRKERSLFWLGALLLGLNAYFTSSFNYDSWGWCIGPRHLTPWVPFLVLPAGLALESLKEKAPLDARWGYGLAAGACASSVLVAGVLTLLNYVPDSTSTALFGVAVPLLKAGYWGPSVLSLLGVPQPWAGAPLYLLVLAAAAWVALVLRGVAAKPVGAVSWSLGLAVALHLLLLSGATRHDPGDLGSVAHLQKLWLTPPGQAAPR